MAIAASLDLCFRFLPHKITIFCFYSQGNLPPAGIDPFIDD